MGKVFVLGLILSGSLLFSTQSNAQKTYTPQQLRNMIKQGKYPQQGKVTTKVEKADYVQCVQVLKQMIASISPEYPSQTVLDTNTGRMEKIWTNDAAVTVTCSAPDKNMVITSAPYL